MVDLRSRNVGGTRFLDPAVLGRIGNLELLARTVVDGFLTGLHRSPYLGFSMDFAEHRPYMPGDDIRRIDWRLFARTDRHYIKLFEADTNANFSVLLDISRSMSYGSHSLAKLDYAKYLAACLTFFSNRQRDRVGLVTFDHEIVDYVPPSMKHLDTILHTLDRVEAGRAGGLAGPLLQITELLGRKGILVVISDFYEDPEAVISAIGPLRARGHDVIVFQVLDPTEIEFRSRRRPRSRTWKRGSRSRWCRRSSERSIGAASTSTWRRCSGASPTTGSTTGSWTRPSRSTWRCSSTSWPVSG